MNNLVQDKISMDTPNNQETQPQPENAVRPAGLPREVRQERMAQNFTNIVAVLMRDAGYENLRLRELEWLVLPPLMAGQWRLAQTRADVPGSTSEAADPKGVFIVPTAVALWARVSPEIDQRLSENLDKPLFLQGQEWVSGDILWLISVAGDRRVVPKFLKQLAETEFAGKEVKLRANDAKGEVIVQTLAQYSSLQV